MPLMNIFLTASGINPLSHVIGSLTPNQSAMLIVFELLFMLIFFGSIIGKAVYNSWKYSKRMKSWRPTIKVGDTISLWNGTRCLVDSINEDNTLNVSISSVDKERVYQPDVKDPLRDGIDR